MEELLRVLNGGVLIIKDGMGEELSASALRIQSADHASLFGDEEVDFILFTRTQRAEFEILGIEKPPMALYSQYDPRWRHLVYAGGVTFGKAGCYVTCVAMMVSLAGYTDEPPEVARKLREAGCFVDANLARPDRIPDAYSLMCYDGPVDVSKDGELRWHKTGADMGCVQAEMKKGPVIMEVDFKPGGEFNQHFVVAEKWGEDITIADPWGGDRALLLKRYSLVWQHWELARAIYGLRLLRVRDG